MNSNKKQEKNTLAFAGAAILIFLVVAIYFLTHNLKEEVEREEIEKYKANLDTDIVDEESFLQKTPEAVSRAVGEQEVLLIDIRNQISFESSHIESSINIPLSAVEEKARQNSGKEIVIIDSVNSLKGQEIAEKLSEEGYKASYLKGGFERFVSGGYSVISSGKINSTQDLAKVKPINLEKFKKEMIDKDNITILDVRSKEDYKKDHLKNSVNIPLNEIEGRKKEIPISKIIVVDEDPLRSFKAAVRLYDMNFFTIYYFSQKYSELRSLFPEESIVND